MNVIAPYVYELAWQISVYGPSTAGELAEIHNRPTDRYPWTAQTVASRLKTLTIAGLLERGDDRIYRLTPMGWHWLAGRNGAPDA